MKTYNEHLLADCQLATDLANHKLKLEEELKRTEAAIKALDLPATYRYRRNNKSFAAAVKASR